MNVNASVLAAWMATLPATDLEAIVNDAGGQYTADARAVAATALADRASGAQQVVETRSSEEISYAVEDGLTAAFEAFSHPLRSTRNAVIEWERRWLPAQTPDRIRDFFAIGLATALPTVINLSIWTVKSASGRATSVAAFTTRGTMTGFTVALIGLLLSYGILTGRSYTRHLAVVFALLLLLWPLRREEESDDGMFLWRIVGPLRWSYDTIKYLLSSSEVDDYYALLRSEQSAG